MLLLSRTVAVFVVVATLWAPPAHSLGFPYLTGQIVDAADVLTESEERGLAARLADHASKTGEIIVVVSVPSLQGESIRDYARALSQAWDLGRSDGAPHAILLLAPHERRAWLDVAPDFQDRLSRAMAEVIVAEQVLPAFRSDDYGLGAIRGTDAIFTVLNGDYVTTPAFGSNGYGIHRIVAGVASLAVLFAGVAWYRRRRRLSHGPRPAVSGADRAGNFHFLSGDMSINPTGGGGRGSDHGGGGDGGGGDG